MLLLLGPGLVIMSEQQQTFILSDYIVTKKKFFGGVGGLGGAFALQNCQREHKQNQVASLDRIALRTDVAPKFGSLGRLYNVSLNISFLSAIGIKSVKVRKEE